MIFDRRASADVKFGNVWGVGQLGEVVLMAVHRCRKDGPGAPTEIRSEPVSQGSDWGGDGRLRHHLMRRSPVTSCRAGPASPEPQTKAAPPCHTVPVRPIFLRMRALRDQVRPKFGRPHVAVGAPCPSTWTPPSG